MKKTVICLLTLIIILSCTPKPNASPDLISDYKLKFSRNGKLERMKVGLFGMGYTTDGKYIYAVNGTAMDFLIKSGVPTWKVDNYGEVSGSGNTSGIASTYSTKNIYRYNVETDKWSINPIQLKPKTFCYAEYVNGEIYVFNGYDRIYFNDRMNRVVNKNVEVFDLYSGEIIYLENNPYPTFYSGSAVWNNKIYVFGGTVKDGLFSNKLHVYDTYHDEWTRLADMPESKQTRGEIIDGILYVFGGYNGTVSRNIHAYDIANDIWDYIGDMPRGVSAHATTRHGDFIWLVGDYYNLCQVAVFNAKAHDFHIIKSNMHGRRHAGAEIIGNKLYVFGGNRESSGSFLSSIQVADISEIEKLLSSTE